MSSYQNDVFTSSPDALGVTDEARTRVYLIHNQALYQLSYGHSSQGRGRTLVTWLTAMHLAIR